MAAEGWRNRGYLSHLNEAGALQHIVFRLADALPPDRVGDPSWTSAKARLVAFDGLPDQGLGARHLSDPMIADLVQHALLFFDGRRYHLQAWCVMPTHVHVLVLQEPGVALGKVVHAWKSFTARQANVRLCRTGAFWAREYFDRAMRNERHAETAFNYIEANPVKASLCAAPEDWPWSSAGCRKRFGETRASGI